MMCSTMSSVTPSLRMVPDQLQGRVDLRGGESRHDLVEHQQPGPGGQGAGQLEALLDADGQIARGLAGKLGQSADADAVLGRRAGLCRVRVVQEGAHQHVVVHGHLLEGTDDLEGSHGAQARDLVGWKPRDLPAVEEDPPRGDRVEAGDAVEERRLAGAVGPDEAHDGPGLDGEAHAVVGDELPEFLGDVLYLKQCQGRHLLFPRQACGRNAWRCRGRSP